MTTSTSRSTDPATIAETPSRRVAVVTASVRDGRVGPTIANWVTATLSQLDLGAAGGVEVDLIDLAKVALPDDSQLYPGGGPKSEVAGRIEAAEAFVFVTPEYNHSYPASLKRLIDWHYAEWMFKPATIVAYGGHGGHAAIEHLRGVLAELNMVTTRRTVGLAAPWENPGHASDDRLTGRLVGALAELLWWTDVLTRARTTRPFLN